jgi:hypothetical protein
MGKNHALNFLTLHAKHEIAVLLDADVVLQPDALKRISAFMQRNPKIALLSGFPRQITLSFWEKLLIPLIHFLLLGYLPLIAMRYSRYPMFGTACGQLIAVRLKAYRRAGGHVAIRARIHDGMALSRVFRRQRLKTELFDATDLASTRMYDNRPDLFRGLMKNAHEGLATPIGLPVWTGLLAFGHVLPFALLGLAATSAIGAEAASGLRPTTYAAAAALLALSLRLLLSLKFHQSLLGAILHPLGILVLLGLQWAALIGRHFGWRSTWKDRRYA